MSRLTKGVAHVSFKGGGLCLPAGSPYDRQILVEEVKAHVRTKGTLQILVDDDRWLVCAERRRTGIQCVRCGGWSDSVCYPNGHRDASICVKCAVGFDVPIARTPSSVLKEAI